MKILFSICRKVNIGIKYFYVIGHNDNISLFIELDNSRVDLLLYYI